jgi:hypothetical protein
MAFCLQEGDLRPIVLRDFQAAARAQRASVEPGEVVRYIQYNAKHGARFAEDVALEAEGAGDDDW